MKIAVDWDRCEANAVCAGLVPELFEVDDDDFLQVDTETPVPAEHLAGVQQAVRACPKAALSLVDD